MKDNDQNLPAALGAVVLRGIAVALDSDVGEEFVADCARNTEGLLPDSEIKRKWLLADEDWANLASNKPLLDAVRNERDHRIHNGAAVREAAQSQLAKAPSVLGGILSNELVSPRHRIEAARELRQTVGNAAENSGPKEIFTIRINLGADETFYREMEIVPRRPSEPDDGELP